jgi:hypothetical protein
MKIVAEYLQGRYWLRGEVALWAVRDKMVGNTAREEKAPIKGDINRI